MKRKMRIVVAGAGAAGLTLAYKLCRDGHDVILAERDSRVGGLAKSYNYDGFTFDVGPHRFYTEIREVSDFIYEILGDDFINIERKSGVWMFGRYFEWPLTAAAVLGMPLPVLIASAIDLVRKGNSNAVNFEEYIKSHYGESLYNIFFKPYTEKFLGIKCSEISKDWALTGIERAVIDSNIQIDGLFSLAKSLLLSEPPLKFIYPKSGGIGVFSEKLKEKIMNAGGVVMLNAEICGINRGRDNINSVTIGNREYPCDLLVWTGTVTDAMKLLGRTAPGLDYLSLLLYNYRLECCERIDSQWCYFGEASIPFNRISIPTLFNRALAPPGKTGLCVEVTCRKGDELWLEPETADSSIRNALMETGMVTNTSDISGLNIERVADAYPIYSLDYTERYSKAAAEAVSFTNLRLLGRTGTFWYNNIDHSIQAALSLYQQIGKDMI